MRETREIVRLWQQGSATVLVTLVRTEGSSYRRPGARLLLGKQGEYAGTISGGCLEAEVVRKAAWLVREGAVVERYSTMFDDTAEVPFGLGCGGVVDLLIEPVDTPECRAVLAALEGALAGDEVTVLTWLPRVGRGMERAVLAASGDFTFASAGLTESELAEARAGVLLRGGVACVPSEVFVERTTAPQRLFILGAGDDAKPVVSMAALLGWRVSVMDGRAQPTGIRKRGEDATMLIVMNSHHDLVEFTLPEVAGGNQWAREIDTNLPPTEAQAVCASGEVYGVTGRSLLLFSLRA